MNRFQTRPQLPDLSILDHIACPCFVLQLDSEGVPRYVAYNATARVTECRPLHHFLGHTVKDVHPDAFGRAAYAHHCTAASTGRKTVFELERVIQGTPRTIRTTLIPQRGTSNTKMLVFGTSVDITHEHFPQTGDATIDGPSSETEQFIALAAHDLRAPMRNIGILANMLRERSNDEKEGQVELIDMMEDVAGKSMTLISDVLAHAQATSIKEPQTTFNLADLCRDLCDILDPQGKHQIQFDQTNLRTYRTALQISLRNLIDNALRHGGRDHLQINISVTDHHQGQLHFVLTDNGSGFPSAMLSFLNGGQFKMDSGYGLLGVRRMVQTRGGTLLAKNNESGQGAIIQFSMPGKCIGSTTLLGHSGQSHVILHTTRFPKAIGSR